MSSALFNRLVSSNHRVRPASGLPERTGIFARIAHSHGMWVQRRQLAVLSAAQLHDIGLTAEQARHEADRPIWNVPGYWRQQAACLPVHPISNTRG